MTMRHSATDRRSTSRRRRNGRGTLYILATLLALSAVLRLGVGASHALSANDAALTPAADSQDCVDGAGTLALLDAINVRENRVSQLEDELAARGQALDLSKQQIESRIAELVAAEQALSDTLALADKAAEGDLARLTAVYENMKPKEAALLFEEMDPGFAAGFVARMRPDAAAALLAGLDPKAAYTISVILAGRNANVPKN